MISTDTMTWTTPAVPFGPGLLAARPYPASSADGVFPVAGGGAPFHGTGLSGARTRGLIAAAGTAGLSTTGVTAERDTVQLNSTTPGEQPPRDPLS